MAEPADRTSGYGQERNTRDSGEEDSVPTYILGIFRSLRFTVGWPLLKSCTHTGIFPSVSGHPIAKRRLRKVPIISDTSFKHS